VIDFGAFPPEFNSARMYAGPGPISLIGAALAWDGLAAELHTAASCYRSVIAGLMTGRWMGPSSLTMASAFAPYMAWTAGAAARAAEAAGQARLAVEIYEAAFVMTVPPPAVAANRVQLATLMATNFFGQNSAAIAATEAQYGEMWAQDAAAMYAYASGSAAACDVTPFNPPPDVTDPAGLGNQASAVTQATTLADTQHVANVVSAVPNALQSLSSPMSAGTATIADTAAGTGTTAANSTANSLMSSLSSSLPGYLSASATPLYGMSSVLAMAQTAQGLAKAAGDGALAAAGTVASGAASAASSGAGALGSLGSGVVGSLGSAASLGPLAVPASWTSVIPTAQSAVSALPNISLAGANTPPSIMGSLPRLAAASGKNLGPRYGVIPTVMTRPPAGGYA
jgi:PPE-repeat protein